MPPANRSVPFSAVADAVVAPAGATNTQPALGIKTGSQLSPVSAAHSETCFAATLVLPEVLTVLEAAALLRVNVKTLYAEIAARRIRVIRLGRTVRIPRAAVTALLAGK